MKKVLHICYIGILLFLQFSLCAQYADTPQDDKYGLDPLLYNGVYYTYFIPSGTISHPYYQSPDFLSGSAVLRGKFFPSLALKYDLLNQQVVLQYKVENGGIKHIILSDAWLESFNLGNTHFEISSEVDSLLKIYQVIGSGPVHILYHWIKMLKLDEQPGAHNYFFTPSFRKSFLVTERGASKYTTNKSLVSQLSPAIQARAKKYLSQKKINVKKANDSSMAAFMDFLNSSSGK